MQAVRLSLLGIAVLSTFNHAASQASYGPGINGDQLWNIQVGGSDCSCAAPGVVASFRFRATSNSSLQAFRIYTLQRSSGYGSGNYGTLKVDLQTDDGSANHFPSGTTLSSLSITNIGSLGQMPQFTINSPPLTAGQIYHLVFT
ncbi:MAG TPA: hypothetical protein VG498_15830, partial [Terriglobales bacterium]|nr:hypothetical protein [Terriglobales bacterium]